ncbi:hypothetical protein [Halobacillus trueperi]|uniref:Uncharacterized protein n=1 Tax=Halobacillus trueperi TaxID=156205 RepID=A0A3E0J1Z7_9BACI|nr:hypothetical protein [Halobacillus trueperi]REJ06945.1 hypothetical protein DYE48_17590 [Halobacillus trueperi]
MNHYQYYYNPYQVDEDFRDEDERFFFLGPFAGGLLGGFIGGALAPNFYGGYGPPPPPPPYYGGPGPYGYNRPPYYGGPW